MATDDFYIGVSTDEVYDFFPLSFWLPNADEPNRPDWTFEPFSSSIKLANGKVLGVGYPVASWSWNALKNEHIEILREQFCTYPQLSADVYIRTPTLQLSSGLVVWGTFGCKMVWALDEERETRDATLSFHLDFIKLIAAVGY